ncbi:MAG: HAD family hydrolase [Planctomycetota bacterium]
MDVFTTAAELLDRLDALLPPASWIACDADGTLWACDVAELAWDELLRARAMKPAAGPPLAALLRAAGVESTGDPHGDAEALYRLFMEGRIGDFPMLEAMGVCFSGFTPAEARELADGVARRDVAGRIYDATGPLLRGLQERGHRVLVVSGSPRFVVEAGLALLDLPAPVPIHGVTLAEEAGRLVGRLVPPITWNSGKVEAIGPRLAGAPLAVAMGDSAGDKELLLHASTLRVLVHPRPALRQAAQQDPGGPWVMLRPPHTVNGATVVPPRGDLVLGE